MTWRLHVEAQGMGATKRTTVAWIVMLCALGAAVMILAGYLVVTRTGLFRGAGIGPLAPMARVARRSEEVRIKCAQAQIAMTETALQMFDVDCGRFPTAEEGLAALVKQPSNCPSWNRGGYLPAGVPNDPWGNPFVYKCPGQHAPKTFDLYSLGPDGRDGTEDDIGNWNRQK